MKTYAITLVLLSALGPVTTMAQEGTRSPVPSREKRPVPRDTIENLNRAIEGEANAAHRYTLFAARADADGQPQVAKLFRATAHAEAIHRRNHEAVLRQLGVRPKQPRLEDVEVESTRENLEVPIKGEREEEDETYPAFAQKARREHVPAAVESFTFAQNTEAQHARLFKDALAQFGRMPATDYYVGETSGDTLTEPPASPREAYTRFD